MENQLLIEQLRENIKNIDIKILELIGQRLELGRKIGGIKSEKSLSLQDNPQENIVAARFLQWAHENNESRDMAKKLATLLMAWTLEVQRNQNS